MDQVVAGIHGCIWQLRLVVSMQCGKNRRGNISGIIKKDRRLSMLSKRRGVIETEKFRQCVQRGYGCGIFHLNRRTGLGRCITIASGRGNVLGEYNTERLIEQVLL